MSRIFFAASAAALIAFSSPASAFSYSVNLPNLTYPPVATPDVTQGCSDVTNLSGEACATVAK